MTSRRAPPLVAAKSIRPVVRHSFGAIPKGVAWSPDGTCILTATEERLHLFELPTELGRLKDSWRVNLQYEDGELVYDYAWYPRMHSALPVTCCFASCSRDHPIHLWDAYNASLRATYSPRNQMDELVSAISLAFSADGARLYAGMERSVRSFVTTEPGACADEVLRDTTRKACDLRGLIGALATSGNQLVAAGSYARMAAVYDVRTDAGPCALLAEQGMGGVTHIRFSPTNDAFLWTGGRRDCYLRCWDLRAQQVVLRLGRACATNQKVSFDITDDDCVLTGSDAGIWIHNLRGSDAPAPHSVRPVARAACPINGCSLHPYLPLLATASGQRRYSAQSSEDKAIEVWSWQTDDAACSPSSGQNCGAP